MKNFFIFILIVAVAVLAYFLVRKDREVFTPNEEPISENPVTEEETSEDVFFDDTKEVFTENTATFEAKIEYPSFGNVGIDKRIKDFVMKDLSDFKKGTDVTNENPVAKNNYGATYKVVKTSEITSIIFTFSEYTGGAHGNIRVRTLNFDNKNLESLSIGSLFRAESDYLTKISTVSRTELKKDLGGEENATWINDGTTPTNDNFDSFYLKDDNTLVIIFQPYQVAPWVEGVPEVVINITNNLKEIFNEKYLP